MSEEGRELEELKEYILYGCRRRLNYYYKKRKQEEKGQEDFGLEQDIVHKRAIKSPEMRESDKVEAAIWLCQGARDGVECQKYQEYTIKAQNLFGETKTEKIALKYIQEIAKEIEKAKEVKEEEISWLINNHCEFCRYFEECTQEAENKKLIQQLPLLERVDIYFLNQQKICNLGQLKQAIENRLECYESLEDKREDILKYLELLEDNKENTLEKTKSSEEHPVCLKEKYYLQWNTNDLIEYIVSFQGNAENDIVYSFSWMEKEAAKPENIILLEKPKIREELLLHYRRIIDKIYEMIEDGQEKGKDVVFHALTRHERQNFDKILKTLLFEGKGKTEEKEKAWLVSEYFDFDFYSTEAQIIYKNPFAETWIESKTVLEKYCLLAIPFAYSLSEVLKAFKIEAETSECHQLSWALKSSKIKEIWKNQNPEKNSVLKEELEKEMEKHLQIGKSLWKKITTCLLKITIEPKRRDFCINHSEPASFLQRFVIKETVSTIKEYKAKWAEYTRQQLLRKKELVRTEKIDSNQSECELFLGDVEYKEWENAKYVVFFGESEEEYKNFIELKYSWQKSEIKIKNKNHKEGHKGYLAEGCYENQDNANTQKILENLKKNSEINAILTEKIKEYPYRGDIEELDEKQNQAFSSLCTKKITLLWGPPGTGKTTCIAKIVAELQKQKSESLKIMITGFTNLAIENCVRKIQKEGVNRVGKYKKSVKVKTQKNEVKLFGEGSIKDYDIIGTTVYQVDDKLPNFDIIIVDEASQMKVPEFLLTYSKKKENTHFLIVGDDKQLPPIVQRKYWGAGLDAKPKEIIQAGSIFSYFDEIKEENKGKIEKVQLETCYRMHNKIAEYPFTKIYEIDNNLKNNDKLCFETETVADFEWSDIVDPEYPVVLCVVDDQGRKDKKSEIEADITAKLGMFFYNHLKWDKEKTGWETQFAVVSPHHVQIDCIKSKIEEEWKKQNTPNDEKKFFVDTVDKMQGQEAEIVVVSYGVTDSTIAQKEKEFIYSQNRFNVSITRAKKKLIVLLSKSFLEPSYRVWGDKEMEKHLSFLLNYVKEMEKGEKKGKPPVTIYRLKAD